MHRHVAVVDNRLMVRRDLDEARRVRNDPSRTAAEAREALPVTPASFTVLDVLLPDVDGVRKPVEFSEYSAAVGYLGKYWTALNVPPVIRGA